MSVETHDHFVKRLTLLKSKHKQLTHGYTTNVGRDGLITVKAKRPKRGFPFRGVVLFVFGCFVFKAFVVASVGHAAYEERLATLQAGSIVENFGSAVLIVDPLTEIMASQIGAFLR